MAEKKGGRRRVAAVIGQAERLAELHRARAEKRWPAPGAPLDGVAPGGWRGAGPLDDTGHLPADCPVRPLGYEGEAYYFVDTSGQVFNTGDKALGVERLQKLFAGCEDFLCWAWPAFDKKGAVTGFKAEACRRDLFAAGRGRGPWSMIDMVRGRGAWLDDRGRLILHCGEFLVVDGQLEDTGELGEHFYVRRPRAIAPWAAPVEEVEDNPAVELVAALRSWNFVRGDVDVMLLLGWIGVALLGAALDWRPSAFIVGDAGTGKSELHRLLKAVLGRSMVSTTNATSAGLYQLVGHDAVPICIDEIEGEDAPEQAQQIIKMARDAASGSMRIRGGADHKGVEFQARSAFLFSAINPPPLPPASLSRLAVLQLRPLTDTAATAPALAAVETVGPRLLRRLADHFEDFRRHLDAYREVLREHGHASRGQDTFGSFLAAAHVLLGDAGMEACALPWEKLGHWGAMLAADAAPEVAGTQPNWAKCLEELMTATLDAWKGGDRATVAQVVWDLVNEQNNVTLERARKDLASAGLGIVEKGLCGEGYALAVPHAGKDVNRLLADTSYGGRGSAGAWAWALRQGPEHIVRQRVQARGAKAVGEGKTTNRLTIGGQQRRCQFVSLADYWAWQEAQG